MDTSSLLSEGSAYTAHDVLPQLPGYRSNRFRGPNRQNVMKYHEGQRFMMDSSSSIVSSKKMISDSSATGFPIGTGKPNHSMGRPQKYFQSEKQPVLCFQAYFKDSVHESRGENYRVHKCDIFYYTEDDSFEVTERKYENSGMPQGNFMKRHQVPKDAESFYDLNDIAVGSTVVFYGRTFQVIGANSQTLAYLSERGRDDASCFSPGDEGSVFPDDNYEITRKANSWDASVRYNVKKNPTSVFAEAMLGKTVDNSGRAGFLKFDRKVLRFVCVWDDRESLYGDVLQFKLHYFVSDDTIEVLAVYGENSGREGASRLVKRCAVPKDMRNEAAGTFKWTDLFVGAVINIYTRALVVVDADASTRQFYEEQGVPLGEPQPVAEEEPAPLVRKIPPHLGIGSEEDSLTSCVGSLVQHPPKKVLGEDKVLRYLAKMVTEKPEDSVREFVISFFLADRTISISEPPKRNTGIVGGPFLKRLPAKSLSENKDDILTEGHFFVGAVLAVGGHLFEIADTDSSTLDYMEENPERFAYSDFSLVIERVSKILGDAASDGSFAKACDDASEDGANLSAEAFKRVMTYFDCASPEQQCITVFRALSEDASVPIDRLVEELRG